MKDNARAGRLDSECYAWLVLYNNAIRLLTYVYYIQGLSPDESPPLISSSRVMSCSLSFRQPFQNAPIS
jgi:hypothetical protein